MPKIVSAAGTSSSSMSDRGALGREVEAAMVKAAEEAMEAGINDPDEIRAIKLEARDRVKAARFGTDDAK